MPNQSRNFQNHLTIIIGPPDQKAIDQNIGNWTNDANDSIDNLWIEHVSSYVHLLTEHQAPEYISAIELLLSSMLEEEVQVANPYLGFTMNKGCSFPVIIFYEDYIQDLSGNPIPMTRFNDFMLENIGEYFQKILQCDWHHISLTTKIA